MFGIDFKAAKAALGNFKAEAGTYQPSNDPTVRALVALVLALAQAFGVQ